MDVPRGELGSGCFSSSGTIVVRHPDGPDVPPCQFGPGRRRVPADSGRPGCRVAAGPLPAHALARRSGTCVSAGPAGCRGSVGCGEERGEFSFAGQGGELGQGVDQAANLILHHRDHPFGDQPPGAGRNRLDQRHQGCSEALGGGKGWCGGHGNMLVRICAAGQGGNARFYPSHPRRRVSTSGQIVADDPRHRGATPAWMSAFAGMTLYLLDLQEIDRPDKPQT